MILSCRSADDGDVDDYPCKLSTLPYPSISHFMKTHPIFFFVGMRVCMCLCDGLVFSCETFSCSSLLEWMMMVETGSPTVSSWNTLLHPAAGEKWLGRVCYGYKVYVFQTGLKETRWSIGDNSNNLLFLNKLTNSLHYIYSTRCVFSMMW